MSYTDPYYRNAYNREDYDPYYNGNRASVANNQLYDPPVTYPPPQQQQQKKRTLGPLPPPPVAPPFPPLDSSFSQVEKTSKLTPGEPPKLVDVLGPSSPFTNAAFLGIRVNSEYGDKAYVEINGPRSVLSAQLGSLMLTFS